MKLSPEQIEAAVEWWVKASIRPKFDNLGPDPASRAANDPNGCNTMASMMATLAHKAPADGGTGFGKALKARLEAIADARFFNGLFVDYGPEGILADAINDAGGEAGITSLPWKTYMWFRDGGVQVRHGYGADEQELLPKTA